MSLSNKEILKIVKSCGFDNFQKRKFDGGNDYGTQWGCWEDQLFKFAREMFKRGQQEEIRRQKNWNWLCEWNSFLGGILMTDKMQKEFYEWFYGPHGEFSCRSEHFHGECEIENIETRRQLLLSWVKSAFEVGFESGYDQGCYEATGGQSDGENRGSKETIIYCVENLLIIK